MALDFRFSFAYTIYAMKKIDIFSRKYVDSLMQTCVHFYRRGIKGDQNTSTKRCKSLEGNKMTPIDLTTTATLANDEAKLVELILYIADKCENDPHFGKTKLNKILFFSDMLYYGFFGNAITGVERSYPERLDAARICPPYGVGVVVGVGVGGLSTWSNAIELTSGTTIPAYLNVPISNA